MPQDKLIYEDSTTLFDVEVHRQTDDSALITLKSNNGVADNQHQLQYVNLVAALEQSFGEGSTLVKKQSEEFSIEVKAPIKNIVERVKAFVQSHAFELETGDVDYQKNVLNEAKAKHVLREGIATIVNNPNLGNDEKIDTLQQLFLIKTRANLAPGRN
jgi:hypothetical protein